MKNQAERKEENAVFELESLKSHVPYFILDEQGDFLEAGVKFQQILGFSEEELVGKGFDSFKTHFVSSEFEDRKLWNEVCLGTLKDTEYKVRTKNGEEIWLSVEYIPVTDGKRVDSVFALPKDITTIKKKFEEALISKNMVDMSPINTMRATPEGKLIYMNEKSTETLRLLEKYLPAKVDDLVGESIDWFHKKPEHQKKLIAEPANLPHQAIITLGEENLNLLVSPLHNEDGKYLGPMVTWEVVTDRVGLVDDLTQRSEELMGSAQNLLQVASSLSASAEETSVQANTASSASEEVNTGVQTVTNNMEEMVSAIKEITKRTNETSHLSNEAQKMAKNTNEIISQLGDSSMDIGNVIKVISSIAQQTNLLALNATIEAARAGEAGKGFAVVANEVKELAKQTAKATSEITKKIENIQSDSKNAIDAIGEIGEAIDKINGYAGNVAAAVEEQAATTNEVTRIVNQAANGVTQINENIGQVSIAASNTGKDASSAQDAAKVVEDIAKMLRENVSKITI